MASKRTKTNKPAAANGDGQATEYEATQFYIPVAKRVVAQPDFHIAVYEAVNTAFHELLAQAETEIPPDVGWYDKYGPHVAGQVAVVALEGAIAVLQQELKDVLAEFEVREKDAIAEWRTVCQAVHPAN